MDFLEDLNKPRNPYDKDLKALREAVFHILSKIEEIEGKLAVSEPIGAAPISPKKKKTKDE